MRKQVPACWGYTAFPPYYQADLFGQYKPNRQYLDKFNQTPVFANKMIPIANNLRRNFLPFGNEGYPAYCRISGF
jgi:hypothetical protein